MDGRESQLFASAPSGDSRRRYPVYASVLVHAVFLWWLVHGSRPLFVKVVEVRAGRSGGSVSVVYSRSYGVATERTISKSDSSLQSAKLALQPVIPVRSKSYAPQVPAKGNASPVAEKIAPPAPPAGQTYGTSLYGSLSGPVVRPALPVYGPSPKASLAELPGRQEGSVIVEIAIDERGKIVQTKVLQSMGPEIDDRVLRALSEWRFTPATRNGMPISSLQDVYFHFPA